MQPDAPGSVLFRTRILRCGLLSSFLTLMTLGTASHGASAAETKSFVVTWFHVASYKQEGDCPEGLAIASTDLYKRVLREMEIPPAEAEVLLDNFGAMNQQRDAKGRLATEIATNRGRINGKPVNVYVYPESTPDSNIRTVKGRYANGFNLDGKGADDPAAFTDPETGEKGVDNQIYRAFGCFNSLRTTLPERPSYPSNSWSLNRNIMPAWLISVTGEDLSKDGPVAVTFDRALEHAMLDARLELLRDATYRIDPDPRSHVVAKGYLKDGTVTTTDSFHMTAVFDATVNPFFELHEAKFRFTIKPDGSASGYLGGYQPWMDLYFNLSQLGQTIESMEGIDVPGLYYALKKFADYNPDPRTGQNMSISSTHRIEAVPAFVVPAAPARTRAIQAQR